MKLTLACSSALAALALAAAPAHADRRSFTRTYEYMTMPQGETELEIYSTQTRSTFDPPATRSFELQLEIEHGITERWDVSLYHVFDQVTGATPDQDEPFHFAELKLRSRYRFSERGEWPVNVLLYAEGVKVFGEGVYEAEGKVIVARDFDKLTAVVNLIGEAEFGSDVDGVELIPAFAAGVGYEVLPEIKLGAEVWGELEEEITDTGEEERELEATAGPAVSWAPATSLWVTSTVGFGLTEGADDLSVRVLLGMHL